MAVEKIILASDTHPISTNMLHIILSNIHMLIQAPCVFCFQHRTHQISIVMHRYCHVHTHFNAILSTPYLCWPVKYIQWNAHVDQCSTYIHVHQCTYIHCTHTDILTPMLSWASRTFCSPCTLISWKTACLTCLEACTGTFDFWEYVCLYTTHVDTHIKISWKTACLTCLEACTGMCDWESMYRCVHAYTCGYTFSLVFLLCAINCMIIALAYCVHKWWWCGIARAHNCLEFRIVMLYTV